MALEGRGLSRQPAINFIYSVDPTPKPAVTKKDEFAVKPELAAKGQEYFLAAGCASCHQVQAIKGTVKSTAPALAKLCDELEETYRVRPVTVIRWIAAPAERLQSLADAFKFSGKSKPKGGDK